MGSLWSFLSASKNQKTLSWLGGGAVVVIAGLWAAFLYLLPPEGGTKSSQPSVKTGNCGVGNSGTATGITLNCQVPPIATTSKP
jgi:hypothetical protein